MAVVIWKETIHLSKLTEEFVFKAPAFAEILTVAKQYDHDDTMTVWYRCSPDVAMVDRKLIVVGTGLPAPHKSAARYVSTVVLMHGSPVLHFFEPVSHD